MKKPFVLFFTLGAGLFTGFLIIVILFQLLGFTISDRVIMESSQGDYVKYNSFDPYKLSIIKQSQPLSSHYIVLISRKDDNSYGHVINYIDPTETSDENIKRTRVIWNAEGIEMTFPMGHKLYIPKERFIGGR
jgi:hypothetical protein